MVLMFCGALLGLFFIYLGQRLIVNCKVLSCIFIFGGVAAFLTGLLYFAKSDLDFYVGPFLSVVYVSGISAVAAKYIFVAAKDMSLFKKQSVTYYF